MRFKHHECISFLLLFFSIDTVGTSNLQPATDCTAETYLHPRGQGTYVPRQTTLPYSVFLIYFHFYAAINYALGGQVDGAMNRKGEREKVVEERKGERLRVPEINKK